MRLSEHGISPVAGLGHPHLKTTESSKGGQRRMEEGIFGPKEGHFWTQRRG